jgi:lysozyme
MDLNNALALAVPLVFGVEGCELTSYLDKIADPPRWTIGHGTTHIGGMAVESGMTCTREEADGWAMMDLEGVASEILQLVRVQLNDHQCAALISLTYNIGGGAFAHSSVLEALNQRRYQQAADRFLEYDDAGGHEVSGLESRRGRERDLFLTGMGAAPYPAKVGPAPPKPALPESEADVLNQAEIDAIARGREGLA